MAAPSLLEIQQSKKSPGKRVRAAEGNKCHCSAMSSGVHCSASALGQRCPEELRAIAAQGRKFVADPTSVSQLLWVARVQQESIAAGVNWCFPAGCDSSMLGHAG